MAKWTTQQFIYNLRQKLDEMDSSYYADDELLQYLNAAILDMSQDIGIQDYRSLTLADNTSSVPFSQLFVTTANPAVNFLQMRALFVGGIQKLYGKLEDRANTFNDRFYIWGNTIYFTKPQSGLLEIFYTRKSTILVNPTDTCDIPEEYQHIPLWFAMAECRKKDEAMDEDAALMNTYTMKKQEMIEKIQDQEEQESVTTVTITSFDNSQMEYDWGVYSND